MIPFRNTKWLRCARSSSNFAISSLIHLGEQVLNCNQIAPGRLQQRRVMIVGVERDGVVKLRRARNDFQNLTMSGGEARRLTNDPRLKYNLAFSSDGSQIAYSVVEGPGFSTYTVSVLGSDPHLLLSPQRHLRDHCGSPSGHGLHQ